MCSEKKKSSYSIVKEKYVFTSNQQLENFLFRTFLVFKLDSTIGSCGPYMLHTFILDCIYIFI